MLMRSLSSNKKKSLRVIISSYDYRSMILLNKSRNNLKKKKENDLQKNMARWEVSRDGNIQVESFPTGNIWCDTAFVSCRRI